MGVQWEGCHGTPGHEDHGIYIIGNSYIDNCVNERAYTQTESTCGNSLFHYRYHTEQAFSNSQIQAFLPLACFVQELELQHDSIPHSLVSYNL